MKFIKIPKLLRDRRAVSAVISNLILIGAVIVIGFAVVAWTYSRSSAYMTQYSDSVNSDVDKLRERVSFEYVFYNNTARNMSVYLMNSGKVGNMNFTTVYVSNTSGVVGIFNSTQFQLKFLNETSTPNLGVGKEGYFVISLSSIPLTQGNVYTVKVVTWRGSSFENTFVA